MKSPSFSFYDNYASDELQLAEFFPVPLRTRLKKVAKKSFWPFVIAAVVATAVALIVAVATGGLSIPGTGLIAAYQGLFFPLVKKIVIGLMAAASFVSTFFFSKWFIAHREAKNTQAFTHHMNAGYEDTHIDLPENLKISNVVDKFITGYHKEDNTVVVATLDPASEVVVPEMEVLPKAACFIPLKTPRALNNLGDKVTHYREKDDYFLVHKSNGTEVELSRAAMFELRDQQTAAGTQASLFLSRPPTMPRLQQDDQLLNAESRNSSPIRMKGSPRRDN